MITHGKLSQKDRPDIQFLYNKSSFETKEDSDTTDTVGSSSIAKVLLE